MQNHILAYSFNLYLKNHPSLLATVLLSHSKGLCTVWDMQSSKSAVQYVKGKNLNKDPNSRLIQYLSYLNLI